MCVPHPGVWAQTKVISLSANEGQKVVLKASYTPDPASDLSTNTVIWNYVTNVSAQQVSTQRNQV